VVDEVQLRDRHHAAAAHHPGAQSPVQPEWASHRRADLECAWPGFCGRVAVEGEERLVQQHLPVVARTAALWANPVCCGAQQSLQTVCDFNPISAYLADQYADDPQYTAYRRFFAAAFPGVIFAFFTLPDPPTISLVALYLQFGLTILVSVGSFFIREADADQAADALCRAGAEPLLLVYAAAAGGSHGWIGRQQCVANVGLGRAARFVRVDGVLACAHLLAGSPHCNAKHAGDPLAGGGCVRLSGERQPRRAINSK
jgi:hypothetical protein